MSEEGGGRRVSRQLRTLKAFHHAHGFHHAKELDCGEAATSWEVLKPAGPVSPAQALAS